MRVAALMFVQNQKRELGQKKRRISIRIETTFPGFSFSWCFQKGDNEKVHIALYFDVALPMINCHRIYLSVGCFNLGKASRCDMLLLVSFFSFLLSGPCHGPLVMFVSHYART